MSQSFLVSLDLAFLKCVIGQLNNARDQKNTDAILGTQEKGGLIEKLHCMTRKMMDMLLCSSHEGHSRPGKCAWNGRRSLMIASGRYF